MYRGFGLIVCDCCGINVAYMDFIMVKDKNGIQHFCTEECQKKHLDSKIENKN